MLTCRAGGRAGVPLGAFIGSPFIGWLLAEFGWQTVFVGTGLIAKLAASLQDVGDPAHGQRLLAHVSEAVEDGQRLLAVDALGESMRRPAGRKPVALDTRL